VARSTVAVLRTQPEAILPDIEQLMRLAGYEQAMPKDATTILKDNISWHMPFLSANTTPWQLEGTILALQHMGYDDLVSVHNNTVVTDPYKGEELNKLAPLYKKYGVAELYNFKPEDMSWIVYEPKAETPALRRVFKDEIRIPDYFVGKNIVHLPTVKCHIYTGTTGSIKNAFGGLLNTHRHYTHSWIHETIVDLLAIQQEIHPGIFAVMDGTFAGDGPGPRTMRPVQKDMMLASADQVAIDAVAAKMMGFDPMSLDYIRIAHERGLGCGDLSQIEIVGNVDVERESWGFTVGNNFASAVGNQLWNGPFKQLQHFFFHTPLVNVFTWASYVYHDHIWWPLKGEGIQDRLRRDTSWGQLFERY
jgi:uncharacterized protein (DUF362 family)